VRVLKSAEVILAEDTRHSARLLQHYDITTPMVSSPLVLVFRFLICFTLSGNAAVIRVLSMSNRVCLMGICR
jgi:hypothetical protein